MLIKLLVLSSRLKKTPHFYALKSRLSVVSYKVILTSNFARDCCILLCFVHLPVMKER